MRRVPIAVVAAFYFAFSPVFAQERVALVIGNSQYRNVPRLLNPANDAHAMSALFKSAGYVVRTHLDVGISEMRQIIRDFSDDTSGSDIAVVYFAGHGMELEGQNYLIATDAKLKRDVDVEDETIALDRVLKVLEPAKRLRLVILDACRDNPFSNNMRRVIASRSIGRGLAKIEPTASDTLVAFAARAGSVAQDGSEAHSPFTNALLSYLGIPGLDVRIAFGRVRDEVVKATKGKQEPFVYGSLGGSMVALVNDASDAPVNTPKILEDSPIWREYEAAQKIGTKNAWDAFISAHPTGIYSDLAREQQRALGQKTPPQVQVGKRKPNILPKAERRAAERKEKQMRISRLTASGARKPATPRSSGSSVAQCITGIGRRQKGFMPEGQSTTCMDGGSCLKSRTDATSICIQKAHGAPMMHR